MRAGLCLALVIGALASIVPAVSQTASDLTKDMIGQWELSTAGRDKTCVMTLRNDTSASGFRLEMEKDCPAALPFTKEIAGWAVKGLDIVRLQTSKGEPVIDFTEVESGIFEGLRANEGVYLLQTLAAARALSKSTDQLIGDWSIVRSNDRVVCGLTLTNTDAGNNNFQVFVKPRCEAPVSTFAPTVWRLERGELLMTSAKGETWRFEADDSAQWRRVPDSADPFILVKR